jgi:hypothetical protein
MKFEIYPSGLIRQSLSSLLLVVKHHLEGVIIDFTSNSMEQLCTFGIAKTYT